MRAVRLLVILAVVAGSGSVVGGAAGAAPGAAPAGSVAAAPAASVAASSPNFVVIVTDDQRWDSIGRCSPVLDPFDFDAGADACMPNLQDLLMDAGTTFLKGNVTQSLCCPSRASILTGQYSTTHGVTNNSAADFDDSSTIATWLHDAGYRTGLFGKYLNGYGGGALYGYIPPGWDAFEAYHGYTNQDNPYTDYPWISWSAGGGEPVISRISDADSTSGEACAEGNLYSTDYECRLTLDFLAADTETPFFVYLNPPNPHSPITIPERHVGTFASIDIPHYPSTNVLPSPNPPSYLPVQDLSSRQLDRIERSLRNVMELTLPVDDMIGMVHDQLAADGRLDETVWVFISDNGISASEHHWQNKGCEYYTCHQVPFVVVCPTGVCNGAQPGSVDAANYALNVDIAPTLADLAGVTPATPVDGLSLVPVLDDPGASWRTEWFIHGNDPFYEGIIGVGIDGVWYKYVEFTETSEYELYDLGADPWELTNLAGDAAHAAVQVDLAARLAAHLGGEPPANLPPVAGFSWSCGGLSCDFVDGSSDADGSVVSWSWDFGDGGSSVAASPSHTFSAAGTYTVSLMVTDDDGSTDSVSHDVTVTDGGGGTGAFIEAGGQVVMEAEHYSARFDRSGDAWTETTDPAGFTGEAAMESGPDDGTRVRLQDDLASVAPELAFDVAFSATGSYHVWLRAWAPDVKGKAMFVGLDGVEASSGIAAGGYGSWGGGVGEWTWSTNGRFIDSVVVEVTAPGVHTFRVWMGDDGVIVDKVVLTTDSGYVPEGGGPPESPRDGAAVAVATSLFLTI